MKETCRFQILEYEISRVWPWVVVPVQLLFDCLAIQGHRLGAPSSYIAEMLDHSSWNSCFICPHLGPLQAMTLQDSVRPPVWAVAF